MSRGIRQLDLLVIEEVEPYVYQKVGMDIA